MVVVNRPLRLSLAQEQQQLEELGATAPQFVCKKTLQKGDVDCNQNRMFISCKSEFFHAGHPIAGILAEEEAYLVRKWDCAGLPVTAFDDHGRRFDLKLKYLDCNGAYRFFGGWNEFVEMNQLEDPVRYGVLQFEVELWAFRSRRMPGEAPFMEGAKEHPDGALGFLIQLHHNGE